MFLIYQNGSHMKKQLGRPPGPAKKPRKPREEPVRISFQQLDAMVDEIQKNSVKIRALKDKIKSEAMRQRKGAKSVKINGTFSLKVLLERQRSVINSLQWFLDE